MSYMESLPANLLIAFPLAAIFMNSIKLNPIRFQCDNYILNVYLYFILLFGLFISSLKLIQNFKIQPEDLYVGNRRYFFLLLALVSVYVLTFIPSDYFWSKHLVFIISTLVAAVSTYGLVKEYNTDFEYSVNTIIALLGILAIIGMITPEVLANLNVSEWILGLGGFAFGLAHPKFHGYDKKEIHQNTRWITAGICGLITFYIPSLATNAAACVNPDYINQIFAFLRPDVQQAI